MNFFIDGPRLLADVGGTNARFVLETAPQHFESVEVLACREYDSLGAAVQAYLSRVQDATGGGVRHAAIAIANPVDGDAVSMVNHDWSFSIAGLREELGLETLLVVNDFAALAMALPQLQPTQREQIGPGVKLPGRTMGLVGPGTGLGVAGIVPVGTHWIPLPSEGGHATYAPADRVELGILDTLWDELGHVSAERLLSGPGLETIHRALTGKARGAADITRAALDGTCGACLETVNRFCAILGTVAGNVALTLGATGGMYIGGGIVPRIGGLLKQSPFRERFEAKGRMSPLLAQIPTYLITEEYPAFPGVSAMLAEQLAGRY